MRRVVVTILGLLSFIAGVNLGVPAIGKLVLYSIYARPRVMENAGMGSVPPGSPVFNLVLNSFLGLMLAAAGIALWKRYG